MKHLQGQNSNFPATEIYVPANPPKFTKRSQPNYETVDYLTEANTETQQELVTGHRSQNQGKDDLMFSNSTLMRKLAS